MNAAGLQSSANSSINASTNATADALFSIFFSTKPCEDKQKSGIYQATQYCRSRSWHFVVQHESVLQTGWCMNVFIRPKQNESINAKSVAAGLSAALVRYAQLSKESFCVRKRICDLAQSRVLDQSCCQDPCVETRKPPSVTPATPVASGTNSEIQNSGDEDHPTRLFLFINFAANDADPELSQVVIPMTRVCREATADQTNKKTSANQSCIQHARLYFPFVLNREKAMMTTLQRHYNFLWKSSKHLW